MDTWKIGMVLCAGITSAVALAGSASAAAPETGDWIVRAGASIVAPESNNGTLYLDRVLGPEAPAADLEVDNGTSFTFTVSYFLTSHVAVELLAAYPFTHDFTLQAPGLKIDGKVDHLPPTLSVQYHYPVGENFIPYVGVGVNRTYFFNADVNAPVDVNIDDSTGLAGQIGLDIMVNKKWLVNAEVRYIDISSNVDINKVNVGNVDINPWLYGLNVGYRF
jgi:outer membrane protein